MNAFWRMYRRALHAIDTHGWRGIGRHAVRMLRARRLERDGQRRLEVSHPFDRAHGVDTGGFVHGETTGNLYATPYYGISPSTLMQALEHVRLAGADFSRATFVDLGCGKGRALLVAARFGFERLVGVELSTPLCAVARENVRRVGAERVEIVEGDAASYQFPATPLVIFLYHPFLVPVLRKVLRNLQTSVLRNSREVYLLYANPTYDKVMREFSFLRQVWFYRLPLSPEDAEADRHGIVEEQFALYIHEPGRK